MIEIKFFEFEQPIGHFALGVMTAEQILDCSEIDRLTFNPITLDIEGGPQREASSKRIKEISEYANTPDATFPTPILLSLKNGMYEIKNNTICFEEHKKVASIVDGQHRIMGIAKSGNAANFSLPVVFVFDSTEEENAMIFAIINGKQTKVPASIIYQLYNVSEGHNPYKTAHQIARAINSAPNSPYYRKLKMLGKKTPGSDEILSQGTFVKELLKLISDNPDEDLALVKLKKKCLPRQKCVFNSYFLKEKDDSIYKILFNVFDALRTVFPEEWKNQKEYILSKTTGFIAVMRAMPSLIYYGKSPIIRSLESDCFITVFDRLKSNLEEEGLRLINNDFGSSESGQKKLTTKITQAIDELLKENNSDPIEEMKSWFLDLYEDPANCRPYDSHEGGYTYYKGEPFDAEEVLFRNFKKKFSEEQIKLAASQLETENFTKDWVLRNYE